MSGKRRLENALSDAFAKKQDKPKLVPALLGAYINGQKTIKVAGRNDFVWCRLRGSTSERVQAFNDAVGLHYDLPVLIYRDPNQPNIWKIYGRDITQYQDWEGVSYIPPHGSTHSFVGGVGSGNDPVWVYKRQIMEMLPRPVTSGTMAMYIDQGIFYWGGKFNWWGGTGTPELTGYKPTGSSSGKFLTVYVRGSDNGLVYLEGEEFDLVFASENPIENIPVPASSEGIPIASILLMTGTKRIGWHEIYDLRMSPSMLPQTGSSVGIYDEGAFQGGIASLDFYGAGIEAVVSGSYAYVTLSASGLATPVTGSVAIFDEGILLGSAPELDFVGSVVDVTISGSRAQISVSGEDPPVTGSVVIYDEGTPLGSFPEVRFIGDGVSVQNSGSYAAVDIAGGGGGTGSVVVLDEGGLLGSALELDFVGAGVDAALVGNRATITIPGGGGGSGLAGGVNATYTRGGAAQYLNNPTGTYWGVPDGEFASGTLSVAVNGIWQTPVTDFQEQYPASGTFVLSEVPVTGSVVSAIWGVLGGVPTGSMVIYDEGSLLGSFYELRFIGAGVNAYNSGTYVAIDIPGGGGGGGGGSGSVVVMDEGNILGSALEFDFVGDGVDATISGSRAQISISGGGGGGGGTGTTDVLQVQVFS